MQNQDEEVVKNSEDLTPSERFNKLDEEQKQLLINSFYDKLLNDCSNKRFMFHHHKPEFLPKDWVVPEDERHSMDEVRADDFN